MLHMRCSASLSFNLFLVSRRLLPADASKRFVGQPRCIGTDVRLCCSKLQTEDLTDAAVSHFAYRLSQHVHLDLKLFGRFVKQGTSCRQYELNTLLDHGKCDDWTNITDLL